MMYSSFDCNFHLCIIYSHLGYKQLSCKFVPPKLTLSLCFDTSLMFEEVSFSFFDFFMTKEIVMIYFLVGVLKIRVDICFCSYFQTPPRAACLFMLLPQHFAPIIRERLRWTCFDLSTIGKHLNHSQSLMHIRCQHQERRAARACFHTPLAGGNYSHKRLLLSRETGRGWQVRKWERDEMRQWQRQNDRCEEVKET